jgi:hypothetical protein
MRLTGSTSSIWALDGWSGTSPSGRLLITRVKPWAAAAARSAGSICGLTEKSSVTRRNSVMSRSSRMGFVDIIRAGWKFRNAFAAKPPPE